MIQLIALAALKLLPEMATWLPTKLFRSAAPGTEGAPPPSFDEGGGEDDFL